MRTHDHPSDRGRGEPRIPERRARLFAAFAYRDFRLLCSGLFVSNIGNWMQFTSLTYLVGVVLAPSPSQGALNLGFLGASRAVPVLLLSPIAGYVADVIPRRRTLLIANVMLSALALILAIASTRGASLAIILGISALQAGVSSFDAPVRQSWVPLLVPRYLVGNAIGLNAIAFNAPLMLGPALAGILIGTFGIPISFYVNAVTQCAVLVALFFMKPVAPSSTSREPMLRQIAQGAQFVISHPVLRWVALLLIVTSLFLRPFTSLLAAFSAHDLHVGARLYGGLLAAAGIGTFGGSVITALYQSERRGGLWFISSVVTALGLIALGLNHSYGAALAILVVVGLGTMAFIGSSNFLMQMLSPDEMRGRAISVYSMIMLGLVPLGSLCVGSLGSFFGLPTAFVIGGCLSLIVGAWVWFAHPTLRGA